ncbi:MAG: IS701 family transposase [Spirulina sp.]
MRETTPSAMPPCFERWCKRFDDCFKTKAQKQGFRHYVGGLLGESERKNLTQMSDNAVGVVYNRLHHFLTESPWEAHQINQRRLELMNQCSQTRISRGFALILDDSGHRKSGIFSDGVGRQYIGEIGKIENGLVAVTTHLYDGKKSVPLDVELYQPASSLPEGKKNPEFKKKWEIALALIDRSRERGEHPSIILTDAGYGNNSSFIKQLEQRKLKYLVAVAKNRKVGLKSEKNSDMNAEMRLDEIAKKFSKDDFSAVTLHLDKPKTVWVATFNAQVTRLGGERRFAIVLNANSFEQATEVDYLMTNVNVEMATAQWIVETYGQRNWVEVFYRDAKSWLGWREAQVRDKKKLLRHFILVFCAYTFILWQKLTGGLRRRWANKPLNTFREALEAFRTAMSFRFFHWLQEHQNLFAAYKDSLGYIWA